MSDIQHWKKQKVADIKDELKRRNLHTDGKKDELLNRLIEAITTEQSQSSSSSTLNPNSQQQTKSSRTLTGITTEPKQSTKTVTTPIKSNSNSNPIVISDGTPAKATAPPSQSSSSSSTNKNVHTIVTIAPIAETEEERKLQRANRFKSLLPSSAVASGNVQVVGSLTEEERRELRKKRFATDINNDDCNINKTLNSNINNNNNNNNNILIKTGINGPQVALDAEVLKKRAEKFGNTNLSAEAQKKLASLEEEEKKKHRMERFNTSLPSEPLKTKKTKF